MTLIVAGFDGNEVFFIADSAITNNNKTLISGFRKIHPLPIIIHQPYFVRTFRRYYIYDGYRGEAVVAFAGSTLVAQHVLDVISEHLRKIRVTFKNSDTGVKYYLIRHCDRRNNLLHSMQGCIYDDNMFLDEDIYRAINIEEIKEIIEYSIKEALKSASKHILDEDDWARIINNEFLFALSCPHTRNNFLYKVTLSETIVDDVVAAEPNVTIIPNGSLGIIGLQSYNSEIIHKYNSLLAEEDIAMGMLDFFENIIDKCNSDGNRGVSKPIIYQRYISGRLFKIKFISESGRRTDLDEDWT